MAHTREWDSTTPAGTVPANQLDTYIQNFKDDVLERLVLEHRWNTGTGSDHADEGKHRFAVVRAHALAGASRKLGDAQAASVAHGLTNMAGAGVAPDWVTFYFVGGTAADGTDLTALARYFPSMHQDCFLHIYDMDTTNISLEFGELGLGQISVSNVPKIVIASSVVFISHYLETEGAAAS